MRSFFAGIIMLSASMAIVDAAQAQKHPQRLPGYGYRQAGSNRSSAANEG